ncbi:MAG: citrate synthase [Actinomycetota bacterium]
MADTTKTRKVADAMTTDVLTASPSGTVAETCKAMLTRPGGKVGSAIVVDDDRVIGIFTERDVVRASAAGADLSIAKVSEWMTASPDSVSPATDLNDAYVSLVQHGYRHFPVTEDGKLAGVISMRDMLGMAFVRPVKHPSLIEAPKGLEGVVVAETEVGDVRGQEGFYHYRQYNATELARKRTLEDVWYLLYNGHLPTKLERGDFMEEIKELRKIPPSVKKLLPDIARAGETFVPLDALRTACSTLAYALDFKSWMDIDQATLRHNAMQTSAVMPTLIMALYRLQNGLEPIEPNPYLPYAANYLYMLTGKVPEPEHARAIEQYLILTTDHGFNASTFTARVITSTGADLGAAVVGAIGALSGPLHGGAPSRALDMLDAIGTPENADPWIRNAIEKGEKIMGFGHRVYKTDDPRSLLLREVAVRLGGDKSEFATKIERTVVDILAELKPGRHLYANVEFYAGVVMDRVGLPPDLFTPTFTSSRVIGWTAHILEQAADNRLIRPSAHYAGPPPPVPVPDLEDA